MNTYVNLVNKEKNVMENNVENNALIIIDN